MPTKNPRLNVVLNQSLFKIIEELAKKEGKSLSVVAKDLIEDAVEKHEDLLLSQKAMEREKKSKKTVSHKDAWK